MAILRQEEGRDQEIRPHAEKVKAFRAYSES